jgi:TonB family protein
MNRRYSSLFCALPLLVSAAGAVAQTERAPLRPMIQIQPEYPETAVAEGIQGFVDLDVTVGEQGTVEGATIVASVPEGVFDAAARAAVMRWRYPAEAGRGAQSVVERIEFRVPVAPTILERGRDAAAASVAAVGSASRNTCVREESKFNYGDRVEIVLINACDMPLAFAGCASGTGQYTGRWTCATTERAGTLLVAPDDARVGQVTLVEDAAITFTDRFVVSRAPNSEYWWLACTLDDGACREAASVWIRSLDGQLASADPQGRSPATLARSY